MDETTGRELSTVRARLAELPESFALPTEMELSGKKFAVVTAEPTDKAGFAKSGRLRLTVREVKTVDTAAILFSVPSICGSGLPETESGTPGADVLMIHEDDWRQCEFVSQQFAATISEEIDSIRSLHATAFVKSGWKAIRKRQLVPQPLAPGLAWQAVQARFPGAIPLDGVAFESQHRIRGSLALRLPDGVVIWGVDLGRGLAVLCVDGLPRASSDTVDSIRVLADEHSLVFVDWCSCRAYASGGVAVPGAVGHPW